MPVRPLSTFDVQELDNVDDALAMLDANIEDLMTMSIDQVIWGPKEFWILDKNALVIKSYTDRIETLIQEEKSRESPPPPAASSLARTVSS